MIDSKIFNFVVLEMSRLVDVMIVVIMTTMIVIGFYIGHFKEIDSV